MFVRAFFLLLLALNIGVASWLIFAPHPSAQTLPASDPGVSALVLLSEREGAPGANSVELTAAPESAADIRADTCRSIGTFPTQADVRRVIDALTPLVKRIQYREVRATQARGYWVYLAAHESREQALAAARLLAAKGVRDYYVVTAGENQNTISLGLFHEQGNAEKRRSEIAALGFAAQVIARTEELPVYWVDFAETTARPVNWRARVANFPDAQEQSIACF
ncbi:SPOR domain-containing protein [Pseudolysobacter antarcticus]|uniref:SPOR domain-containing protein n=1 Tax=Pseudolysobacter antarcticus TaxID=2511995 RepID=A0A411HGC9_9GAMM|nr:SPOR domain-containing protein [Pseudolysobacter antarcticus]QBB69490.1 SPOR domain-containing protein [Pseudolysobacter antarcticus]